MDIYINAHGTRISEMDSMLCINSPELPDIEKVSYSIIDTLQINCNCSITSSVLSSLLQKNIPFSILDSVGHICGTLKPAGCDDIDLFKMQIKYEQDIGLAKNIVCSSLKSRINMLKYLKKSIDIDFNKELSEIASYSQKVLTASCLDSLRGYEGMSARNYFSSIGKILGKYGFSGRNRNPPKDKVNAALSYGYGILAKECYTQLVLKGFNPCIGIYHLNYRNRPSLSYDLMELFRQGFVDRHIIAMFNKNMLNDNCFSANDTGCFLNKEGKTVLISRISGDIGELRKLIGSEIAKLRHKMLLGGNYGPYVWTFW